MANVLVENLSLGPVAPFDAAATVLTVGGFIIAWTWSENYGDASASSSTTDGFKKAAQLIWNGEQWPSRFVCVGWVAWARAVYVNGLLCCWCQQGRAAHLEW